MGEVPDAAATTVNVDDTEPDGTDVHDTDGDPDATLVVVVPKNAVVVVVVGLSESVTFELSVYQPLNELYDEACNM